jgi:hypothetical protein
MSNSSSCSERISAGDGQSVGSMMHDIRALGSVVLCDMRRSAPVWLSAVECQHAMHKACAANTQQTVSGSRPEWKRGPFFSRAPCCPLVGFSCCVAQSRQARVTAERAGAILRAGVAAVATV